MSPSARSQPDPSSPELTAEQIAAAKAAAAWAVQLMRTLKTCRLYEPGNPAAVRFRQELHAATQKLVDTHGALSLRFTAADVQCEGQSIHAAASRDDNLALVFYRDGIRTLAIHPGIEGRELDALVDAILQVTGPAQGDDDLVTLFWQAHVDHLEIGYVPSLADAGGVSSADGTEEIPWPTAAQAEAGAETAAPPAAESAAATGEAGRSDDWSLGEQTAEIEAGFDELQSLAASEVLRFRQEYEAERQTPLVDGTVALADAYLAAGANGDDQAEIVRFLPRVLRKAYEHGNWRAGIQALAMLERHGAGDFSLDSLAQELMQPISMAGIRERIENAEATAVNEFVAFAQALGDPGVDVLGQVMAGIQNPRHQAILGDAVIEVCRSNPERLAPWLADSRVHVVRNTIQMLGAIGGGAIVGMLQAVLRHPDPRVRLEVASALRNVDPKITRPLLIRLLEGADTRMFCSLLHQLSQTREVGIARLLIGMMVDPRFDKRPEEEQRAVYSALGATAEDENLPDLEAELHKGSWFSRSADPHQQAVARCIARIGTPAARAALERGAQSKRGPVRKLCEEMLARWRPRE